MLDKNYAMESLSGQQIALTKILKVLNKNFGIDRLGQAHDFLERWMDGHLVKMNGKSLKILGSISKAQNSWPH